MHHFCKLTQLWHFWGLYFTFIFEMRNKSWTNAPSEWVWKNKTNMAQSPENGFIMGQPT